MKKLLCLIGISVMLCTSCSKSSDGELAPDTPNTTTTTGSGGNAGGGTGTGGTTGGTTTPSLLVDPVNCPPTLVQNNTNAFQYNYAKMKIIKGMSGVLSNLTPTQAANNMIHVYLKGTNGQYYHLPGNSAANIPYDYTVKAVFPSSTFAVSRGTGAEEIVDGVIVVGVNPQYASTFYPPINFTSYETVKNKLGF
jgi:hypothetical protein